MIGQVMSPETVSETLRVPLLRSHGLEFGDTRFEVQAAALPEIGRGGGSGQSRGDQGAGEEGVGRVWRMAFRIALQGCFHLE